MPSFSKDAFKTPFGIGTFLRSTQDVKVDHGTCSAASVTEESIDGFTDQKILQVGEVLAVITSGPDAGKLGPFQASGTDEVQTLTVTGTPTGGTFTLTYNDGDQSATTAAIAHNASAATVVAALELLPNIGAGGVTGGGGALPATPVTITFAAVSGNPPQLTATASYTGGTNPAIAVTTTTPGTGATDGRQTLTNIKGINNTFLPSQLMHRDVEVAYVYDAAVIQSRCTIRNAAGARIPLDDTTAAEMFGKKHIDIRFK